MKSQKMFIILICQETGTIDVFKYVCRMFTVIVMKLNSLKVLDCSLQQRMRPYRQPLLKLHLDEV